MLLGRKTSNLSIFYVICRYWSVLLLCFYFNPFVFYFIGKFGTQQVKGWVKELNDVRGGTTNGAVIDSETPTAVENTSQDPPHDCKKKRKLESTWFLHKYISVGCDISFSSKNHINYLFHNCNHRLFFMVLIGMSGTDNSSGAYVMCLWHNITAFSQS